MFLSEPARTAYDLNFEIARFPVRIHPLFWIAAVVLGASGLRNSTDSASAGLLLLTWVTVMFFSILVHELGHALAMRFYGQSARIVLYLMGGLAIPDSSPYAFSYGSSRSPQQQIVISAAGPAAGFLLALLTITIVYAAGGSVELVSKFPFFWNVYMPRQNEAIYRLVDYTLTINILWGLVNLLPVYPLDGGQISRELLVWHDPGHGMIRSLWLSVFTAGALACWGLYQALSGDQGMFLVILFGSLAYGSYAILQQLGGGGFGGGRPW